MMPSFLKMRSVKTRVTLLTLGIFVVSIWALSFYTNHVLREDLQRLSGEQQMSAVTVLAGAVDRDLTDRLGALAIVARTISPELIANPQALQRHLEGDPVFQSQFNGGATVVNTQGVVIGDVPSSAKRLGLNYMDRSFVVAALKEGRASIGQPVMGKALKAPIIVMASPIKSAQGQVVGAIMGVTNLGLPGFLDQISANQYGQSGGYALVAPKERLIVTATDKRLVMKPILEPGKSQLVDRFVEGYEGSGVFTSLLGGEVLASAKRVPVAGWYIAATLPTAEAFATLSTLQYRLFFAALALTLVAAGLTWWVLGWQLTPLATAAQILNTQVQSNAELMALPVQRDDEIGDLIGGFNRALQQLGERERTVKDITARMKLATDNAGIGIWEYDVVAGTLTWDAWMYRLYGLPQRSDVGPYDLWAKHLHPDDRAAAEQALASTLQTGARFDPHFRIVWADGSVHHLQAYGKVTTDASGRPVRVVGTNWDITQAKALEHSLKQAQASAEQAARVKSEFLANMSHEIRTPMNAVLGMLKLLHSTELSARQQDYAGKAQGAAKSLLGLLNDILDFSKIDAGKMQLEMQPFRIDQLMRDLSVVLSANVGIKPVEVLFDIDPRIPKYLVGDAMRLQQVLLNLSGNAIKFTAHGEVVVQIKVVSQDGSHIALRFAVRDTGIGIAPENHQHIFSGFSQAEASTTRRFGGTGLGLSISKRLVELMGGQLHLDSVLGQGSTFDFTLSLAIDKSSAAKTDTLAPALGDLDVLVVDDNPVALELLVGMAQSCGWKVDAANGGAVAIEKVKMRAQEAKPPYHAILMDWEMPGLNGWDVIERIRQLALGPQDPIIVMVTAHGREMLAQRTMQEQARLNAFLVKPVTASMLFDAVADARAGVSQLRTLPRAANHAPRPLQGMRILVVEDNLINQQVARELLIGEGAVVVVADDGQRGVAAVVAARPSFDAVLMDIQMPVMDGYSATKVIRQELGLADLPIIAMTANAMKSDRDACIAAGMNDHVGKPFDLQHLVEVLLTRVKRVEPGKRGAPSKKAHPPTPAPVDLPATDALDVDAAIARMGGNTSLYARALQAYLTQLHSAPDSLDTLMAARDWSGAGALLHTIKGLSGTLGATYMAAVAQLIESRVSTSGDSLDPAASGALFREAATTTGTLLQHVAEVDSTSTPNNDLTIPLPTLSAAELVRDLQALHLLLENFDMEAMPAHSLLREGLTAVETAEFSALEAAMNALDFASALVHCDALIKKFST